MMKTTLFFTVITLCALTFAPLTFASLWDDYKLSQLRDPQRLQEHQARAITYHGMAMKYVYSKLGNKPSSGYPLYIALHGGGGAPPSVNDSQWQHMQIYYRDSIKEGIYLAPRGVTNTWNLHFVDESYALYDRLIENMILFEDVDPNRVYILGFSAGGDGIYQIAPRMNDRFAAVNMSAGHPNGVSLTNVYNLPFLLQVGEMDSAYNRNRVAAEYCGKLQELHTRYAGGFVSECNIHYQRPHNFYDNDARETLQKVLRSPAQWLRNNDRTTVERNTNAIAWLKRFVRDPLPRRVVWDLQTRAPRAGTHGQQNYWLDIGSETVQSLGVQEIVAGYDFASNTITIETPAPTYLKILLKQGMVDFSRDIRVIVNGESLFERVVVKQQTRRRTLLDRGDPNYIFDAALLLSNRTNANGRWELSQVD
ncbi:MAG: hypothetical protein HQK52_22535 [Oligoflexia bacterium]|nr:hypothetical protein [Oligoflexia bacterium]